MSEAALFGMIVQENYRTKQGHRLDDKGVTVLLGNSSRKHTEKSFYSTYQEEEI